MFGELCEPTCKKRKNSSRNGNESHYQTNALCTRRKQGDARSLYSSCTANIRNGNIHIIGTKEGDAIYSSITFEQTGTTSNLHLQNTALLLRNIALNGNHKLTTAGYGVVRAEYGSSVTCENVVFGQAEGSANFGNNIELRDASRGYIVNSIFRVMSTVSNASGIFVDSNGEAVAKNCSFAEDSVSKTLARVQNGSTLNQMGTEFAVHLPTNHASIYRLDGKEQGV